MYLPVKKTLEIVKELFERDFKMADRITLLVQAIVELLRVCVSSVYFRCKDVLMNRERGY